MTATTTIIWWVGLVITLVVFVPVALYGLNRLLQAARSIERYAAETLTAAAGIVGNTKNVAALDVTIRTASHMLDGANSVERKLAIIADVLAERAE